MSTKYKILIMGASYGSLLGTKLALAGHAVHLVCHTSNRHNSQIASGNRAIARVPATRTPRQK